MNVNRSQPSTLAAAQRHGLQVHVWTIDEEAELKRLIDLGVDGLMTDEPALLKTVLVARGLACCHLQTVSFTKSRMRVTTLR